jgi:hypothetical protein
VSGSPSYSEQVARLDWEPVKVNGVWRSTEPAAELRNAGRLCVASSVAQAPFLCHGRRRCRRCSRGGSREGQRISDEGLRCSHIRRVNWRERGLPPLCPCYLVPLRSLHPWGPHPPNGVSRRLPQLHLENRRPPRGE